MCGLSFAGTSTALFVSSYVGCTKLELGESTRPRARLCLKSGKRVDCVGIVAEKALKQTLVTNVRSLMPGMMPTVIKMTLDRKKARRSNDAL